MAGTKTYRAEQESLVLELLSRGASIAEVARDTGLSRYVIYRIQKKTGTPKVPLEQPVGRLDRLKAKSAAQLVLEEMPPLNDLDSMSNEDRERFWNESWNVLQSAAVKAGDLKLVESLLTKFRTHLIRPAKEVVHIQPVQFSPVLPTLSLERLAHDMTSGMVDLIKGQHLTEDDANRIFSAVVKYYPEAKASD
jgi:transposase-like protein